jgi:hypothetical protein
VKSYFKGNHILFENMTACSIDGAAWIVSRYRRLLAHCANAVPGIFCIHCVAHTLTVSKILGGHLPRFSCRWNKGYTPYQILYTSRSSFPTILRGKLRRFWKRNNTHTGKFFHRFIARWWISVSFSSDMQFGEEIFSVKCEIFYLSDISEKLNLLKNNYREKRYPYILQTGHYFFP